MIPSPLFFQICFLVASAAGLAGLALFRLGRPRFRSGGAPVAFGVVAAAGLGLFFFARGTPPAALLPGLFLFWALLTAGWGLAQGRADGPETLSGIFRYACLGAAFGFVILFVGTLLPPEVGAGVFLLGALTAAAAAWVYACSGIRGSRFAFAAIPAAVAGVAAMLLQPEFAAGILSGCLALVVPASLLRPARRKERKRIETSVPTHEPGWKPTIILEDEEEEEEVVVIRRQTASAPPPREQAPAPPPAPAPEEGGGLATEPGRRGNVRVDPWTGAAISEEEK